MLVWGLIPPWAQDQATGARPINAARRRRAAAHVSPCLSPAPLPGRCRRLLRMATIGRRKQPFYIRLRTARRSPWPGYGRRWQPGPQQIDSCTILTTTANSLVAAFHSRMPVILHPADYDRWLDPRATPPEAIESFWPYPSQEMETTAVSDWVNVASHEGPRCLAPAAKTAEQPRWISTGLQGQRT